MLRPSEIDAVLAAARQRGRQLSTHRPKAIQQMPAPRTISPGGMRGGTAPAKPAMRATRSVQAPSGTGINPWWRYEEGSAPGDGRVMVNVGTGNLLLQDDDMNVPHKGMALAFRRTYNSQSLHDVAGSDGAARSIYGNGWTNTFDAHLSGDPSSGALTVWDIDGARYDYTGSDTGGWTGPPGQHATLTFDISCGYLWTKKSGTTYYFFETTDHPATCPYAFPQYASYSGTLYQLLGRNRNTVLTLRYSWVNGDSSPTGKIHAISVQPESGQPATLTFDDVSGHQLLKQLLFPDGLTYVNYDYDAAGNLISVSRPANNAGGYRPQQTFGYQSLGAGSVLWYTYSPRLNDPTSPFGSDGGFTAFAYTGTNQASATLNEIARKAVINPAIPDGSNQPVVQPGYPSTFYYSYEYYTTGVPTPTLRDTDGHATNWVMDSLGRPTQTQECRAAVNQACSTTDYLMTNESWDADNNLIIEVDPRGAETDYAYDVHGNTVAVGAAAPSSGSFRPTSLYSYDQYDNVVAYCDPNATHALRADWSTRSGGARSRTRRPLPDPEHSGDAVSVEREPGSDAPGLVLRGVRRVDWVDGTGYRG